MFKKLLCLLCLLAPLVGCFANSIQSVSCTDDTLSIVYEAEKRLSLIELMPYQQYSGDADVSKVATCDRSGNAVLERFVDGRDRLYSRFALVDAKAGKLVGDYQYVTSIQTANQRDFKLLRPESIKGLSCIVDIDDAIELGVKYIHENVYLNELVDIQNADPTTYHAFDGLKIPLNMTNIRSLDKRLKRFADAGIAVFVVFLNQMPRDPDKRTVLVHPKSDVVKSPTRLGAFNVMDPVGMKYFAGTLEFMTERYTRPDRKYGQISSLIVGNEIQQHWVWYNMGDVEEDVFLREYETALRLAWLACSKSHPDLRVYVSMDHHWAKRGFKKNSLREIPGNVVLTQIAALSRASGDYPWNVAFHPYPENLFQPKFWYDKSPTDDFDTSPRITFKNIDLLPRFMKQEKMLYNGRIRDIALTEQGFHSPDGPDGEDIQAAAYAYGFYKVKQNPEISAFILHRHVDHRGEGGLRLGLWTNDPNGDVEDPLNKKKIWEVFKYADTDRWQEAFAFAKPIIGIDEWGQVPSDKNPQIKSIFKYSDDAIVFDFVREFEKAKQANNLECRPKEVYRAAGWLVPAIFQHPPQQGTGTLTYPLTVPKPGKDKKVTLLFETILGTQKGDGVNYAVAVNGRQLWNARHKGQVPKVHTIDLTQYAGTKVKITFSVDKYNNADSDWSYWASPIMVIE